MKNVIRIAVMVLALLFVPALFAVNQMVLYESSTGNFLTKELIPDGSGGLVLSGSTDDLGTWGTGYDAFMGDVDGDGFDEMVAYKSGTGDFFFRELADDGGGGLFLDPATYDHLGVWGTGYDAFMGDVDGDGFDEMTPYKPGTGDFFFRRLADDGGGGLFLDTATYDNLGVWGTNYNPFMGDVDGDGVDEMVVFKPSTGDFFFRRLAPDGGGGLFLDPATYDYLGNWGDSAYRAFMGDLDGDGVDEIILYQLTSGNFYSRKLMSDGGGGLMMDASSQDFLGSWGGSGYDAFMGNLPPANCAELWQQGLGTLSDLDENCRVDFNDWTIFAGKWLTSNNPPINKLDYYGFYEPKKEGTGFYQQGHVNALVRSMGLSGPGFDSIEIMRQFGQGGMGLILEWSTIFRNDPNQWTARVNNVKATLQTHDLLQYAVLNYVIDEPHANSSVTNPMVTVIKNAFPAIPTFVNWGSDINSTGEATGTTADVVGFDHYVWPNGGGMSDADYFNSEIDPRIASLKSQAPGKDIILVSQSGWFAAYFPTSAEMQFYADKAISDPDIRGLLWFYWGSESFFDQNDLDFFETTGTDAAMPNIGEELIFSQDYETWPWLNMVNDPWDGGEATSYATTSVPYMGGLGWGVGFGNIHATNKRRAYEPMSKSVTESDDFSLAFYMQNDVRGNSASGIGYVGLFGTDANAADYYDPFVGVNLGAVGSPREPKFMLQVRIGSDTYTGTSSPLVSFNKYYRVEIDYNSPSGTFDYRVIDPNTNSIVVSDSYTLSGGTTFSLDAFGISDVNPAADGRLIGVRIDTVNVNAAQPVLIDCAAIWAAGLGEPSDFDENCYVDWVDLGFFVNQWVTCDDPADANCPY